MMLAGKRAIITGSTLGIGREAALFLAALGARVVVNGRGNGSAGPQMVDEVVDEIRSKGGSAIGVAGSVDDPAFAKQLIARCIDDFGGVDIVINNAGINHSEALGPVHECPDDTWRRTMGVNLDGIFYVSRAALPHMIQQRWGRIINAGSLAGTGRLGGSAYSASKAGIMGLSRAMAADYGPYGITVNAYNPEALTPMLSDSAGMNGSNDDVIRRLADRWIAKGWVNAAEAEYMITTGGPDGVVAWLAYLCTDEAEYLNGQVFAIEARRVALLSPPDELRVLFRNAARQGVWSMDELIEMAPIAFPVKNGWPRREGLAFDAWLGA